MCRTTNILIFAVLLFFTACGKAGVLSTEYIITPFLQVEKDADTIPTMDVKAYIYNGDTADWKVVSWEDALEGKITSKGEEGGTRSPDFTSLPDADGRLVLGPVTQETFMVLVCYTLHDGANPGKMYAWRRAKTLEDMPQVNVKVTFRPWQEKTRYMESQWAMINDNPPEPETDPEPATEPVS